MKGKRCTYCPIHRYILRVNRMWISRINSSTHYLPFLCWELCEETITNIVRNHSSGLRPLHVFFIFKKYSITVTWSQLCTKSTIEQVWKNTCYIYMQNCMSGYKICRACFRLTSKKPNLLFNIISSEEENTK